MDIERAVPAAVITLLHYDDAVLATLALPDADLVVTRGLGSGLARRSGDPAGRIWAVGDRGPNLKVPLARKRYGVRHLRRYADVAGAKLMPLLSVGPALSELRIDGDRVTCVRTIALRDRSGRPLTGVPVPGGFSEPVFDLDGAPVSPDPGGADTEGIVALADGSFWIADEYGPSLLHVAADGTVRVRLVPEGHGAGFEGADYPVVEALPRIAGRRQLNRGFEALALAEDEQSLFLAFQSPLADHDGVAYPHARHVRIWQIDLATHAILAEYLYPLDRPESFRRDAALDKMHWGDIKVSELLTLPQGRLLVLERGSATTKLYVIAPEAGQAVPMQYRDAGQRPSLEALSEDSRLGSILPLEKTLILSTDDHPEVDPDLEGVALLAEDVLLLVNDNDFGVDGVGTRFWRVDLPAPV